MNPQIANFKAGNSNLKELPWLEAGYEVFAINGPEALKIEALAKTVGISKSSFYHHFADLEVFKTALLDLHMDAVAIITDKEKACKSLLPDLQSVFIEHKTDLLFHRQLRINRSKSGYEHYLNKAESIMGMVFIDLVINALNLQKSKHIIELVYDLAVESFFLSITPENFNELWLTSYFQSMENKFRTLHAL
ncbi:MAG: TetR/AcrR family transcriptional regulator [Flexibacteraceae bacterium]